MYYGNLQLPSNVRVYSVDDESMSRKKKGKGKEGEDDDAVRQKDESSKKRLATLDIFAGCGGLSEGLEQSGSLNALQFSIRAKTYLPVRTSVSLLLLSYKFASYCLIISLLTVAGASQTKWAIEYEEPAGEAFKLNHPGASVFIDNCNVILRYAGG